MCFPRSLLEITKYFALALLIVALSGGLSESASSKPSTSEHAMRNQENPPYQLREVTFACGDVHCAGLLYLPAVSSPERQVPAVALGPGLGSLKEMGLLPYAEQMARAGIAALLFDYRHWGKSDGEPREWADPNKQVDDYRYALSFLAQQPEVDGGRLGVAGLSFSGGIVLQVAAADARVKAVVSVMPATDLYALVKARVTAEQFAARWQSFAAERERLYRTGEYHYIPLAMPDRKDEAIMGTETFDWQERMAADRAPHFRNRITLDSLDRIYNFAPALVVDRIAPTPLLMMLGTEDSIAPPDTVRSAFGKAGEPKRLLELHTHHYGVYESPFLNEAAAAMVDWFGRHLQAAQVRGKAKPRSD